MTPGLPVVQYPPTRTAGGVPPGEPLKPEGAVSMAAPDICPAPSQLTGYARDELDTQSGTDLERHLRGCDRCRDEYLRQLGRQLLVPDVPDCHVVKEIGRGRFGVVYKAWWMKDPPRLVALKVLSSLGEMERSRFDREIAVLKKLDSPWIVRCFDSGGDRDSMYFIMDYVEGALLDEYVKAPGRTLDEKLAVFELICRGVAAAHGHGVIHRDLKPRNIIVDPGGQPHILDFGICSVGDPDWSSWSRGTITAPGDLIGTLRYMSPEQAWGGVTGPIDARSDLWALGIILHELVTEGGYPYSLEAMPDRSAHEALLERIRRDVPRLPRLMSIPRGRDLEILLERCLAWEPERRIESAEVLAADVAAIRSDRRIRTRPLSLPYRVRRLAIGAATRSRWMFSTAFVALVGLTLAVTTFRGGVRWREEIRSHAGAADVAMSSPFASDARDSIVIVGVGDETPAALVEFAQRSEIPGVTPFTPSWRGVHARLMRRMVEAKPRLLVWDYYFESVQPADAEMVQAILALEAAGVPVMLAAQSYGDDGRPRLSSVLQDKLGFRLRHGLIHAHSMTERAGQFVLAVRRSDGRVIPNLAMVALAALIHPDARLETDWGERSYDRWLTLRYEISPGRYHREHDRVAFTGVTTSENPGGAIRGGDALAFVQFELQTPEGWERRTVPYEHLLNASGDELRDRVAGKVVLIGDVRKAPFGAAADRHPVKYGTRVVDDVPGCYLLADAHAGLFNDRFVRVPEALSMGTWLVMLLLAAIGCLAPIRLATGRTLDSARARELLRSALTVAAAACFIVMTTVKHYWVIHVAMAVRTMSANRIV